MKKKKLELLPCPFCNSKVELMSLGGHEQDWLIYCSKCSQSVSETGVSGDTKKDIIKAWNTRKGIL